MSQKKTDKKQMPVAAFNLPIGQCSFIGDGDQAKKLRLTLYDGSIVKHWYWGNLAFDLSSMKLAKKSVPILADHDTARRIGFSDNASFDGKFVLEGKPLNNEDAAAIQRDSDEGYPFEASLRFDPDRSKIEYIKDGQVVTVNGRTLTGPGALISNAMIMEGSVCTFGALTDCHTETFTDYMEGIAMPEKDEKNKNEQQVAAMTVAKFTAEYPEIFAEVTKNSFEEGQKDVRDAFGKFVEKFGDDPELLVQQFAKGASLTDAITAQNAKLKKKLADKDGQQAAPAADGKPVVDPALQEFSDDAADAKPAEAKLQTDEQLKETFAKSAELQDEFGGRVEDYVAVVRAEADGRVHIS